MNLRRIAALSAIALMLLGSTFADARPGHRYYGGGRALFFAAPIIAGAYLASRYYYPPTYYYPPAPLVYIEQPAPYSVPPQSQYQPDTQAYWYYCAASRGYYPHVQTCPGGWQKVPPQSPPR